MFIVRSIAAFLVLQNISLAYQNSEVKIAKNIVENANKTVRYCVFGDYIQPNLRPKDEENEPSEYVSDFFLVVNDEKTLRRQSNKKAGWNIDKKEPFGGLWYSRVVVGEKKMAGYDERMIDVKSLGETNDHGIADFNPWGLVFGIEENEDFSFLIEPNKFKSIKQVKEGALLVFQTGEAIEMRVLVSKKSGLMPTKVEYWMRDDYMNSKYGKGGGTEEYLWLLTTINTKWRSHDGVWYPLNCVINKFASKSKKPKPKLAVEVEMNWVFEFPWEFASTEPSNDVLAFLRDSGKIVGLKY